MAELFQSTSPGWRTTQVELLFALRETDFNPRPPGGGRRIGQRHSTIIKNFNPRPPGGGRPKKRMVKIGNEIISIHVPRVEDDQHNRTSA